MFLFLRRFYPFLAECFAAVFLKFTISPGHILFWMMIWRKHVAKRCAKKVVKFRLFHSILADPKLSRIRLFSSLFLLHRHLEPLDSSKRTWWTQRIQFFAHKSHTSMIWFYFSFFCSLVGCVCFFLYRQFSFYALYRPFSFETFTNVRVSAPSTWSIFIIIFITSCTTHFLLYSPLFIMIGCMFRFSVYVHSSTFSLQRSRFCTVHHLT